jgi:hypothetical protein
MSFAMNFEDGREKDLFFVTADAERIGTPLCRLVVGKCFFARSMTVEAVLETQGRMHFYHLRVLAVADIARIRGRIGYQHQEKADNCRQCIYSHAGF